jgi:hypothetical protein
VFALSFVWKSDREFEKNGALPEKAELASLIESLGFNTPKLNKFLVMISGDAHSMAYDSGEYNMFGKFPIFQCSPLDRDASCKWSGWSDPGV